VDELEGLLEVLKAEETPFDKDRLRGCGEMWCWHRSGSIVYSNRRGRKEKA